MSFAIWTGLAAVVLAGVLQGLFAVPMKYAPRWNYENIWLIFSLVGMVVLPWMLTTATVPHLREVYSLTPMSVLVRIGLWTMLGNWIRADWLRNESSRDRSRNGDHPGTERVIGITDPITHSQSSTVSHISRPHLPGWSCDYAGGDRILCARGNAEGRRSEPG